MKTSTMFLLAGAAGVAYYLYKKGQAPVTVPVPVAVPTPAAAAGFGYFGDDTTGTPGSGTVTAASTDEDGNVVVENYIDDDYGAAVPYGWGPSWGVVTAGGRRGGRGGRGGGRGGRGGRH